MYLSVIIIYHMYLKCYLSLIFYLSLYINIYLLIILFNNYLPIFLSVTIYLSVLNILHFTCSFIYLDYFFPLSNRIFKIWSLINGVIFIISKKLILSLNILLKVTSLYNLMCLSEHYNLLNLLF